MPFYCTPWWVQDPGQIRQDYRHKDSDKWTFHYNKHVVTSRVGTDCHQGNNPGEISQWKAASHGVGALSTARTATERRMRPSCLDVQPKFWLKDITSCFSSNDTRWLRIVNSRGRGLHNALFFTITWILRKLQEPVRTRGPQPEFELGTSQIRITVITV
jgi:hypothetical protein